MVAHAEGDQTTGEPVGLVAHCDHKVVAEDFEIVVGLAVGHTVVAGYNPEEQSLDDNSAQTKELVLGDVAAYEEVERDAAVGADGAGVRGVEVVADRVAAGAEAAEDHVVESHGVVVHDVVSADRCAVAAAIEDLRNHPVVGKEVAVDSELEVLYRSLVAGHWDHCIQLSGPAGDSGEDLDFVEDHCSHFGDDRMVLTRESHLDLLGCHLFPLEARDHHVEAVGIVEVVHIHIGDAAGAADSEEEGLGEEEVVGSCMLLTSCETVAAGLEQFSIDGSQVLLGLLS